MLTSKDLHKDSSSILPLDFASKIRWRMRYDRNPVFITLQDKHAVKGYAAERNVKTAPLLYCTENPDTIPFDDFPDYYMIKANHGWQWNILGFESKLYLFADGANMVNEDGSLLNKQAAAPYEMTRQEVVEMCHGWLTDTHLNKEWCYQHIKPNIVVEELLFPAEGTDLKDYRMYTFDGKVRAISLGSAEYRRNELNAFFSPDWELFELSVYKEKLPDPLPARPEKLDEMVAAAERLGKGVDFVRVDLYDTTQGIMLGEMTIYPESGSKDSPTGCPIFNRWLGSQWEMDWNKSFNAHYWNIAYKIIKQRKRVANKLSL